MAKKEKDAEKFLKIAQRGYAAGDRMDCPYLLSSDSYIAYAIGVWMKQTGRSEPRDYAPSYRHKAYVAFVNDMLISWAWDKDYGKDIVERVV